MKYKNNINQGMQNRDRLTDTEKRSYQKGDGRVEGQVRVMGLISANCYV